MSPVLIDCTSKCYLEEALWYLSSSPAYKSKKEEEGNVLFNDTINIFYLLLHGTSCMVKNNTAREETHCHHFMA